MGARTPGKNALEGNVHLSTLYHSTIRIHICLAFENEYYSYSYLFQLQKTNNIHIRIWFKITICPNIGV